MLSITNTLLIIPNNKTFYNYNEIAFFTINVTNAVHTIEKLIVARE